jgi:hypothetical protein
MAFKKVAFAPRIVGHSYIDKKRSSGKFLLPSRRSVIGAYPVRRSELRHRPPYAFGLDSEVERLSRCGDLNEDSQL